MAVCSTHAHRLPSPISSFALLAVSIHDRGIQIVIFIVLYHTSSTCVYIRGTRHALAARAVEAPELPVPELPVPGGRPLLLRPVLLFLSALTLSYL